jgi:hypothetical protein
MPKVIRVEIEYDNGVVYRQTGENAEKIWQALTGAQALQQLRGGFPYDGPQLEKVEKPRMMTNPHDPEIQPHLEMPECKEVGCVEVKP